MNQSMPLKEFFKGSDSTLGVFYPKHHLVAVFRDKQSAENVAVELRELEGISHDNVIAADGREVIEFERHETRLFGLLLQAASRFFETEQAFTDHDLEHARQNAGFLVLRCATEAVRQSAWPVIESAGPLDARYYRISGIEHLAGDEDTN